MKLKPIFLCILFISMVINPCSDGDNVEDKVVEELGVDHNHQEDSDDSCPVTCFCNCCGSTVTYQPLPNFQIQELPVSFREITLFYTSIYNFHFHPQSWEPPRNLS